MTTDLLAVLVLVPVVGAIVHRLHTGERGADAQAGGARRHHACSSSSPSPSSTGFRPEPGMQFEVSRDWMPALGIRYHVGIDGLSPLAHPPHHLPHAGGAARVLELHHRVKGFQIFMLLLEAGMLGVFVALDLFLFYIFWEAMLIPMYFLIGIWGHERRIYAAVKFFLYTMAGSALMLVAFIALYKMSPARTFDILALAQQPGRPRAADVALRRLRAGLRDQGADVPVPHLAARRARGGAHRGLRHPGRRDAEDGRLRLPAPRLPALPGRRRTASRPGSAPWPWSGILYGALVSLVQPNIKKLVAYSSVSHLGFVMLGIAAFTTTAVVGAVYQMLNHGISTGALFLCVGMLYDRRHTFAHVRIRRAQGRDAVVLLALPAGVPLVPGRAGLNGFVGEFLILMGSWTFSRPMVALASLGVILAAAYILWMVQRVLYGEVTNPVNRTLPDLSAREFVVLVPLVVLAIVMGVASPYLHAAHRAFRADPDLRDQLAGARGPRPTTAAAVADPARGEARR